MPPIYSTNRLRKSPFWGKKTQEIAGAPILYIGVLTSAENRDPNLNRLIGLFNERSSILDRSLSHSKHVTMNLGRDYKSGTQPQLTCPTYLRH